MFTDIWDKEDKSIKINKFNKNLMSRDDISYNNALNYLNKKYGFKYKGYEIEFKNSNKYGFSDVMSFSLLRDCFAFLMSSSFQYLFEKENIDFIKIESTDFIKIEKEYYSKIISSKEIIFKYEQK